MPPYSSRFLRRRNGGQYIRADPKGTSAMALRSSRYYPSGNSKDDIHYFMKTQQIGSVVAGAGFTFKAFTFQLSDCIDKAAFQGLFDRYRLTKVVVRVIPQFNISVASPLLYPYTVITCVDTVESSPNITTASGILDNRATKIHRPTDFITRTVYPRIQSEVVGSGIVNINGGANSAPAWINTQSPSVPHLGFWFAVSGFNATTPPLATETFNIYATYYLEMASSV